MRAKFQLLVAGMFLATTGTGLGQPIITNQPQNQTNAVDTTATFTVGATGTEPLAYQWQQAFDLFNFLDRPEGTNNILVITNVQYLDPRNYRVIITNIEGAVTSAVAHVYVVLPPSITVQPTNWPIVSLGASVTNRVYASGTWLNYQWCLNGAPVSGQTKASIILTNLQLADAGDYTAVVTNLAGSVTSRVVTLAVDPTFTRIMTGPIVTEGSCAEACSWGDLDGDGRIDLFVATTGFSGNRSLMYQNQGQGLFIKVTNAVTRASNGQSIGNAWADYDNNGTLDLLSGQCCGGADQLFRNEGGGNFSQLPSTSFPADRNTTRGVAWADYDLDGNVDLFMASQGGQSALYHNNGNGSFTSVKNSGLPDDAANRIGCSWCDYDRDGYPDLVTTIYDGGNYLYHNNGAGSFSLVTSLGQDGWGVSWGDYDNDGWPDVFITSLVNLLYHNEGNGTFTQIVTNSVTTVVAMGSCAGIWGDYDNDGYLDLFVANEGGDGENNFLFHNDREGGFTQILTGSLVNDLGASTGSAWGDFDNDGFLDLAVANFCYGPSTDTFLYRNNGNNNHWMMMKLVGTASNKAAIGAKVRVLATIWGKPVQQLREISGGGGYASQNDLRAHFGLGDATNVDLVRIEWPSGNVQELTDLSPNQIKTVTEQTYITPVRPTGSLGGTVALTSQRSGMWQWYHDGVLLEGKTNKTLSITNLAVADGGRYSVVVETGTAVFTNYAYLFVDTQFTKITTGPVVTDRESTWGGSWVDFDHDGDIDLVAFNIGDEGGPQCNALYRNDGTGQFTRLTTSEAGDLVGVAGWWPAGVWGDLDNDGDVDCVACNWNDCPMNVFLNDGHGVLRNSTNSGALVTVSPSGYAALADYDNDGWLDVFVGLGVGGHNHLFRGTGNGTFVQVTNGPIVQDKFTATEAQAWSDYDGDGDLDLIVSDPHAWWANSSAYPVHLYRNEGSGLFTRITTGVLAQTKGSVMFPAWADYDNDGRLDLFLNLYDGDSRLFHNEGNGEFTSQTFQTGPATAYPSWGDFDNDGDLDLIIGTGQANAQTNLFFRNDDGRLVRQALGSLTSELGRTGPILWGDFDNDGFLDLFVGRYNNEANSLFHNNGNGNHWIMVDLKGTKSNWSAIGAKVRVKARIAGKLVWQLREISGGYRYQTDVRAHFGLGDASNVLTLRIEWPSGTVEEFANVASRQILTIVEPSLKGALGGDGKFHLNMTMSTNRVYSLEVSSDLVTWTALTNCTGSGSRTPVEFVDPDAPSAHATRFYRMK